MFECSSKFCFQDMKPSTEYPRFQGFYTPNFDGPKKLKYLKMSWIWPPIILFGAFMFLRKGNTIHFCFPLI